MKRAIFTFGLLLWCCAASAERVYSFAVVPQQSATQLAQNWMPVLEKLSTLSGVHLRFQGAADIPAFEDGLGKAEYDFAYMNPYHFAVFNERSGYHAVARAQGERISGIIVVSKDSPLHNIRELSGKTLVFPSPAAFAASLVIRAELRRNGILIKPKYVKSHDSVYMNVARGFFPAGGGVPRTLALFDAQERSQLRVLWQSPEYTTHAIAVRSGVNPAVTRRVWQAMQQMNADPESRELLSKIRFSGFEAALDSDWNDVRALGIRLEDTQIQLGEE